MAVVPCWWGDWCKTPAAMEWWALPWWWWWWWWWWWYVTLWWAPCCCWDCCCIWPWWWWFREYPSRVYSDVVTTEPEVCTTLSVGDDVSFVGQAPSTHRRRCNDGTENGRMKTVLGQSCSAPFDQHPLHRVWLFLFFSFPLSFLIIFSYILLFLDE
jgi:hypothetical protein